MNPYLTALREATAPYLDRVVNHHLYSQIRTLENLQLFTEHHVYAVWDFMCLLKALQRVTTCVDIPWVPRGDAVTRRLINEIVLGEECDALPEGGYLSHFELYFKAMEEIGADTLPIHTFVEQIRQGHLIYTALKTARVPLAARDFVLATMDVVNVGAGHSIAAAFSIGRENVIPLMFLNLAEKLHAQFHIPTLLYYLQRHVQLDGEEHNGLAEQMLVSLCGLDASRWEEATAVAIGALTARVRLWDAVADTIRQQKKLQEERRA